MDTLGLAALFRSEVNDTVPQYLWSDADVSSYMDDAQKTFCRMTDGISDATTHALTRISVAPGDIFKPIDPRILKIRYARRLSDSHTIEVLNYTDLNRISTVGDYGWQRTLGLDETFTGTLTAIVIGMQADQVRLLPIPKAADTIDMVVYRLPLADIDLTAVPQVAQNFEIPAQHVRCLLYWMKHLAHMKQDAETFDKGKSEEFRQQFLAYCEQAKHERERREHTAGTTVYGGIMMRF